MCFTDAKAVRHYIGSMQHPRLESLLCDLNKNVWRSHFIALGHVFPMRWKNFRVLPIVNKNKCMLKRPPAEKN